MNHLVTQQVQDLGFLWSSCFGIQFAIIVKDTGACHGLVHHGRSECLKHFFIKLRETSKVASKYYTLFHLIPLILKLRKMKNIKDLPKIFASTTK